ncbi:exosome non-catalytic core subunit rrp46 [Ascosphaera pollenicola]|nr:exosome non-catalytic core subunit rrp46 [Ascosphaera pollenicola]
MSTTAGDLPTAANAELPTMLARKFGKETANYFSKTPLNRYSFLRGDAPFLSAALRHPSSRFLLYKDLCPLVSTPSEIYLATYNEVSDLVPETIYDEPEEVTVKSFDSSITQPLVIFLGVDESRTEDGLSYRIYKGAPYFAVDVTPKGTIAAQAQGVVDRMESKGLYFDKTRAPTAFPAGIAAMYAQGRHYIDWNHRYTFCGSCGSKMMSIHAGAKRVCPPTDAALIKQGLSQDGARPPCSSREHVSNVCFPRTDPTIIVAVLSHDGKRVLLGRQRRWPPKWYSTLAGFVEPAESVEDAVRREVWEEAGVSISRVVIHSSQPWPFPENLMIGAIGQTGRQSDEEIHLEHDAELDDAKWFPIAEVAEALRIGTSSLGEDPGAEYKGGLRLPGQTAIAHQLMKAVVEGDYWKEHEAKI